MKCLIPLLFFFCGGLTLFSQEMTQSKQQNPHLVWQYPLNDRYEFKFANTLVTNDRYVFYNDLVIDGKTGEFVRQLEGLETDTIVSIHPKGEYVVYFSYYQSNEEVNDTETRTSPTYYMRVFREKDGKLIWQKEIDAFDINLYPPFVSDRFILVNKNKLVCAFDTKNGDLLWRKNLNLENPIYGTSLFGKIVTGLTERIVAVNPDSDKILWTLDFTSSAGELISPIEEGKSTIYLYKTTYVDSEGEISGTTDTTPDTRLWSINKKTGKIVWEKVFPGEDFSLIKPIENRSKCYLVTKDHNRHPGYLYALNCKDGSVIWKRRIVIKDVSDHTPLYTDSSIFIWTGTEQDNEQFDLLCLDAKTGNILWKYQYQFIEEKRTLTRPVTRQGNILFSDRRFVYSLRLH